MPASFREPVSNATLADYDEVMGDRPYKLDQKAASYGPATSDHRCDRCMHFFLRKTDGMAVCEIVRPIPPDQEEILPEFRCKFFTEDGEDFPLYEGSQK